MDGLHHKVNNFTIRMNNNIIMDGKGALRDHRVHF